MEQRWGAAPVGGIFGTIWLRLSLRLGLRQTSNPVGAPPGKLDAAEVGMPAPGLSIPGPAVGPAEPAGAPTSNPVFSPFSSAFMYSINFRMACEDFSTQTVPQVG